MPRSAATAASLCVRPICRPPKVSVVAICTLWGISKFVVLERGLANVACNSDAGNSLRRHPDRRSSLYTIFRIVPRALLVRTVAVVVFAVAIPDGGPRCGVGTGLLAVVVAIVINLAVVVAVGARAVSCL